MAFEWKIGKIVINLVDFFRNPKYEDVRNIAKEYLQNKLHVITQMKNLVTEFTDELHDLNRNLQVYNSKYV